MPQSTIKIYQAEDGKTKIDVKLKNDTVWLSLNQLSELFQRDKSVISRHIKNIFNEKELDKKSTVAKFAIVQKEGKREVVREIEHYNLDVIISVGYRVKSKRGVQFRIWANKIIKDYLVKGYVINHQKLLLYTTLLNNLKDTINNLTYLAKENKLEAGETREVIQIMEYYKEALDIIDKYDKQNLEIEKTTQKELFKLNYETAIKIIEKVRENYSDNSLFALEKDDLLKSSIANIYQTFDKRELYPSTEEKAAMLLYSIIKNHPFVDGNKRVASILFLFFLEKNGLLFQQDGKKILPDTTLVALALMIALSKTEEKDLMIKLIVNLIRQRNN